VPVPNLRAQMKIIKSNDGEWAQALDKGPFGIKKRGLMAGKLGVSQWELAPGKKSFPFHRHHVTEEALYVLSGNAKVRTEQGETPIGPGDFVSFPAGGSAHQLINDGAVPCVFLGISSGIGADVVEYPDSGKVAVAVGQPGSGKRYVFEEKSQVDYFKGEA
jgi:uncharacterized cupin superfamily protein